MAIMKIDWLSKDNPLLAEAAKAKRKFHPILTIIFCTALVMFCLDIISFGLQYDVLNIPRKNYPYGRIVFCLLQVITIVIFCLFIVKIEKRSLGSMGIAQRTILSGTLTGIGYCLFFWGILVGVLFITGNARFLGIGQRFSLETSLILLIPTIIHGLSEEVMYRGYMLVSLANRMKVAWAIVISSILFGSIHHWTLDITSIPLHVLCTQILLGVFMSLLFLRTGNIWSAGAFHGLHNWINENIISLNTSDSVSLNRKLFQFQANHSDFLINLG